MGGWCLCQKTIRGQKGKSERFPMAAILKLLPLLGESHEENMCVYLAIAQTSKPQRYASSKLRSSGNYDSVV